MAVGVNEDYYKARELGIVDKFKTRRDEFPHHRKAERLFSFLMQHDLVDYDDYFGWKSGGEGDNGEVILTELDAFFELLDQTEGEPTNDIEEVFGEDMAFLRGDVPEGGTQNEQIKKGDWMNGFEKDSTCISYALNLWANFIETGDVNLTRNDVISQIKLYANEMPNNLINLLKELDSSQQELITRLRAMASALDNGRLQLKQ